MAFLQLHVSTATHELLTALQTSVIQQVTAKGDTEQLEAIDLRTQELMPKVRQAAIEFKKVNATPTSDDH